MSATSTRRREPLLQDLERRMRTVDTLLSRRWPAGEVRRGLLYLQASSPKRVISQSTMQRMKVERIAETAAPARSTGCGAGRRASASGRGANGGERRRSGPNGSYEWHGLGLLNLWKLRISRETEPTEPKVTINSSKNGPREEIGNKGSEGSVGSAEHAEQEQQILSLIREGMAERFARAQVLGECEHGVVKGGPCDECDIASRFGGGA
jgi:hypothetical protein